MHLRYQLITATHPIANITPKHQTSLSHILFWSPCYCITLTRRSTSDTQLGSLLGYSTLVYPLHIRLIGNRQTSSPLLRTTQTASVTRKHRKRNRIISRSFAVSLQGARPIPTSLISDPRDNIPPYQQSHLTHVVSHSIRQDEGMQLSIHSVPLPISDCFLSLYPFAISRPSLRHSTSPPRTAMS